MSEYVEKSLQESLFELKFMKQIGLFTDEELGKVLKKRREHEYKIRRRTKELKEYIEYIEYEKLVLELIAKRRKDMNCYSERRKIEIPIYKRIRRQFQNACSRFPGCADLWLKQIEFCLEKNETQMIGVLFTNALRLHPHNESIWIMAAQHEVEKNASMAGARNFLQRALRQNEKSKKLYLEYFRLELLNAEKMNTEAVLKVDGRDKEVNEDDQKISKGCVAFLVFESAVEEITGDLPFYLNFIQICSLFPCVDWIVDEIYESIKNSVYWQDKEDAQAILAIRPLTTFTTQLGNLVQQKGGDDEDGGGDDDFKRSLEKLLRNLAPCLKQCRRSFRQAHHLFNSEKMWQCQLEMLMQACGQVECCAVVKQELLTEAMMVCCEAFEADMMSLKMAEQWMDLLKKDAAFAHKMACLLVHKWPSNLGMWSFMFQQLMHPSVNQDVNVDEVVVWLRECNKIANKDPALVEIWRKALHYLVYKNYPTVEKVFESGIATGSREVKRSVKEIYLTWLVDNRAFEEVRKVFERLFKNRPNTRELLNIYIKAELSQNDISSKHIRRAYESAVSELGDTCVDLWLEYIKFEASSNGSPQLIGQIHYKAVKCLNSGLENEFIEKYSILKASNYES